jgi:hypothetical protein
MATRIFGRLTAWQNWIFQRPNAVGEKGALKVYGKGENEQHQLQRKDPQQRQPREDRTLQRALEQWQPNYLQWWGDMGPDGSQNFDVYLRTAVSVDPQGWAQFGHVKMPDYRWGIFLNPGEADRKIHFGDHKGEAAWQDVPGEHRANLRRIIVTQGDTEPASSSSSATWA